MTKTEAMRALREARQASPVRRVPAATYPLCGHRGVSGKTCIRPDQHPEKSHRYG